MSSVSSCCCQMHKNLETITYRTWQQCDYHIKQLKSHPVRDRACSIMRELLRSVIFDSRSYRPHECILWHLRMISEIQVMYLNTFERLVVRRNCCIRWYRSEWSESEYTTLNSWIERTRKYYEQT